MAKNITIEMTTGEGAMCVVMLLKGYDELRSILPRARVADRARLKRHIADCKRLAQRIQPLIPGMPPVLS